MQLAMRRLLLAMLCMAVADDDDDEPPSRPANIQALPPSRGPSQYNYNSAHFTSHF